MGLGASKEAIDGDSRVWVTGASSGLGEALALDLARRGAQLILSARRGDVLRDVAARCLATGAASVRVVRLDQATVGEAAFDRAVTRALDGGVDLVVLNGGVGTRGTAVDTPLPVLKRVLDVNFLSQAEMARRAAAAMLDEGTEGRIVVVSSVQAFFGQPERSAYAASKHAIHGPHVVESIVFVGYFDALRSEVGGSGVSVTIVAPGYIATAHSTNALQADGTQYARVDANTARGADPEALASEVLDAAMRRTPELTPSADLSALVARYLRTLFPTLLFSIMQRRATNLPPPRLQ